MFSTDRATNLAHKVHNKGLHDSGKLFVMILVVIPRHTNVQVEISVTNVAISNCQDALSFFFCEFIRGCNVPSGFLDELVEEF